ncbi:nadh-ubiquinone oxidoreductase 304 kda subunit precursor [Phaffia rhodozyma]|uniref:Nadh-ubiquinone oxidoreductase 304 kDa subunit n=1 Tax=Phaffia rhodozyma TaxID=264483 RepID=A0A0F7SWK5_PHARH|nr:nadh-ubiquinone oxidoreductase 304 kda subunit precursor [Phaffia rhodozyma]
MSRSTLQASLKLARTLRSAAPLSSSIVGRKALSVSAIKRMAEPSVAPFQEPAGVNPALKSKTTADGLHVYGQYLLSCMPKYISQFSVYKDELVLYTAPDGIVPVIHFLRDHSQTYFKSVMDITAVDYPSRTNRFEVVYNLLSIQHQARIRVKTWADEVSPVPSITSLFRGADWYEREVWDMFGVFFVGHPDLRRVLTDYGFEGHPLRKDFPLTGYTEVRYDEEKKRVVYEPLQLTQAFRNFESASPWEQNGPGVESTPESFKIQAPKPEEPAKK